MQQKECNLYRKLWYAILQEAKDGYRNAAISADGNPEEIKKRAMHDPEVQKILGDPAMRLILEQMQEDPKALKEALAAVETLIKKIKQVKLELKRSQSIQQVLLFFSKFFKKRKVNSFNFFSNNINTSFF